MFFTLVEHTLGLTVSLYNSTFCSNDNHLNNAIFLKQAWPQIYGGGVYDGGVRGISGEILNYYCVLQWVFMDILIISISICLSTRLHLLNEHLKQFYGMVNDRLLVPFSKYIQFY